MQSIIYLIIYIYTHLCFNKFHLPAPQVLLPGLLANATRLEQLFAPQKLQLAAELQQLRQAAQELRQRQREMAELELEAMGGPWGAQLLRVPGAVKLQVEWEI